MATASPDLLRSAERASAEMRAQADQLDLIADNLTRSNRKHVRHLTAVADRLRSAADLLILEAAAGDAASVRLVARISRKIVRASATVLIAATSGAVTGAATVGSGEFLDGGGPNLVLLEQCLAEVTSAADEADSEELKEPFGLRVQRLLRSHDGSKASFARSAGISSSGLDHIVAGQKNAKATTLAGLAKAAGLSVDELVEGTDAMEAHWTDRSRDS